MSAAKTAKPKSCFVIGPIGKARTDIRTHADWLFQGIIQPVFAESYKDWKLDRADTLSAPGMIDSQVISHLLDAELVIADLSFVNPNAFYELGIRHMAQKPVIHMFLDGTDIPFDVSLHRAIPYAISHPDELTNARKELAASIAAVLDPQYEVENPITQARGKVKLQAHATPEMKLMMDEIDQLKRSIEVLKLHEFKSNVGKLEKYSAYKRIRLLINNDKITNMNKTRNEVVSLMSKGGFLVTEITMGPDIWTYDVFNNYIDNASEISFLSSVIKVDGVEDVVLE